MFPCETIGLRITMEGTRRFLYIVKDVVCVGMSMCGYIYVGVRPCVDMSMFGCVHVRARPCVGTSMWEYVHV